MGWDGFQREMLAALGHQVFELATGTSATAASAMDGAAAMAPDAPIADASAADRTPALLHAIARAAGVAVAELPALPAADALRSPAAKRALWPRLRALRSARARRTPG